MAESDGRGLIVDRYGDTLVAQFTSAYWGGALEGRAVRRLAGCYRPLQSWANARTPAARAKACPNPPAGCGRRGAATDLVLREHDWRLALSIARGTRPASTWTSATARKRFADTVRRLGLQRVLNCYCYTGGFTVAALARRGAAVVGDLHRLVRPGAGQRAPMWRLNGFDMAQALSSGRRRECQPAPVAGRVASSTPSCSTRQKFAPTVAHAERAARAYKDINRLGSSCWRRGMLFTYSCSGGISADLFHKIVASARADAGWMATSWSAWGRPTTDDLDVS